MNSSNNEQSPHLNKKNVIFITKLRGPSFSMIPENKTFSDSLFKINNSLIEDIALNNQLKQTANNFGCQNDLNSNEIKYTMFTNKNNINSLIISENPKKNNENFQNDKTKLLEFDKIYDENQSIDLLYNENIQQSVKNLFLGKKSCILLFGPKNSGKSYILRGGRSPYREEKGLLHNCAQDILESINLSNNINNNFDYILKFSIVLIYNNELYDLLNNNNLNNTIKNKSEITKQIISNLDQIDQILKQSIDNRILLSDYLKENDLKRKSHFILSMYLEKTYKNNLRSTDLNKNFYSQIDLIELASSNYGLIDIVDKEENNILSNIKKDFYSIYEKILSLSNLSESTIKTKINLFLEGSVKNKNNIIIINCVIPWEYPLSYSYKTSMFLSSLFNKINKNSFDNDGFFTFSSSKNNSFEKINNNNHDINIFNKIPKKTRKTSNDINLNFNYSDEELVNFLRNSSPNPDKKFNNSAIFFNKKNINTIPNKNKNNNNDLSGNNNPIMKKIPVPKTKLSYNYTASRNINDKKNIDQNYMTSNVNHINKKIINKSISINDEYENENSLKNKNTCSQNFCTDNKLNSIETKLDAILTKTESNIKEAKNHNIKQIISFQNKLFCLENKNKSLKREIKKISDINNELTIKINVEKNKNKELLEKNEKLSLKIFDMTKKFENFEKVHEILSEKAKNLENEMKILIEEKNNYEIENNNLREKYYELKKRNDEEFSLVEEKINMVNNNMESLRDENKKLRLENENLRININLYSSQIDNMKDKLFEKSKIKDLFFTNKKNNTNIIKNENELDDSLDSNNNKNYSNENGLNKISESMHMSNIIYNKINTNNNNINAHNTNKTNSNSIIHKKIGLLNDLQKKIAQYRNQRTKKYND